MCGLIATSDFEKRDFNLPPENTAHGALLKHITTNANKSTFQPMNINFGLMPYINSFNDKKKYIKGRDKKKIQSGIALDSFEKWIKTITY